MARRAAQHATPPTVAEPQPRFALHGVRVTTRAGVAFEHWFWLPKEAGKYAEEARALHGSAEIVRRTEDEAERELSARQAPMIAEANRMIAEREAAAREAMNAWRR